MASKEEIIVRRIKNPEAGEPMVEMKNDTYGEFKYSNEIYPLFVFSEADERTN